MSDHMKHHPSSFPVQPNSITPQLDHPAHLAWQASRDAASPAYIRPYRSSRGSLQQPAPKSHQSSSALQFAAVRKVSVFDVVEVVVVVVIGTNWYTRTPFSPPLPPQSFTPVSRAGHSWNFLFHMKHHSISPRVQPYSMNPQSSHDAHLDWQCSSVGRRSANILPCSLWRPPVQHPSPKSTQSPSLATPNWISGHSYGIRAAEPQVSGHFSVDKTRDIDLSSVEVHM
mmetsp:Transcript_37189/g.68625  ORF Transcript_37189/g.68625 Transcript_37189/m.68625 type:complete len:227 (+) Transcript_37189:5677-6357(+)